ncbi:MAG: hypothetical protein ACYDCQ_06185 [Dehalococcoidia bacterium]
MSTSPDDYRQVRATEIFYDVAVQSLARQLDTVDGLDTKASTIFAAASTILAIVAAVLQVGIQTGQQPGATSINPWVKGCLIGSVAAYIPGFIAFLISYRVTKWEIGTDIDYLTAEAIHFEDDDMRKRVGQACLDSYQANKPRARTKKWCVTVAFIAMAVETAALMSAAVLAFTL